MAAFTFAGSLQPRWQPPLLLAASTFAGSLTFDDSLHLRWQPPPSLAVSAFACSLQLRWQPPLSLATTTFVGNLHPCIQLHPYIFCDCLHRCRVMEILHPSFPHSASLEAAA
jgi:hypothetical protein